MSTHKSKINKPKWLKNNKFIGTEKEYFDEDTLNQSF